MQGISTRKTRPNGLALSQIKRDPSFDTGEYGFEDEQTRLASTHYGS
jgi:hypothetical protein